MLSGDVSDRRNNYFREIIIIAIGDDGHTVKKMTDKHGKKTVARISENDINRASS